MFILLFLISQNFSSDQPTNEKKGNTSPPANETQL